MAGDVRPQGPFRRLGISGTLHFLLLLWIACFLRMSLTKSLLLVSRGVPYTRAAGPFGDEIVFQCQSRVKSLRIFSSITCFSASKYVSCALGSIAKGIIVALARLSRHGWVCFGYKVSGLGIAVCFSLCLERFAYFCPWLGVVFCFRITLFLIFVDCAPACHSLGYFGRCVSSFSWRFRRTFESPLGSSWRATGVLRG